MIYPAFCILVFWSAVVALEDCIGTSDIRKFHQIPARCRDREDQLAACIEGLQQAAEERTAACPTKLRNAAKAAAEQQRQL